IPPPSPLPNPSQSALPHPLVPHIASSFFKGAQAVSCRRVNRKGGEWKGAREKEIGGGRYVLHDVNGANAAAGIPDGTLDDCFVGWDICRGAGRAPGAES